jgi:hypothetical protein
MAATASVNLVLGLLIITFKIVLTHCPATASDLHSTVTCTG